MAGKTKLTTWGEVSQSTSRNLPPSLQEAFADLQDHGLAHLSLPYGERIISRGKFAWNLLGEFATWEERYKSPIPVVLVGSRVVELYDTIAHEAPGNKKRPRTTLVRRSIPIDLIQPGSFFGLFENFANFSIEPELRATAGGTTLLLTFPIGNVKKLKPYLASLGSSRSKPELEALAQNLQYSRISEMAFGPFLRDLVRADGCDWRCDLYVFSPEFMEAVKKNPPALLELLNLTISQLATSQQRERINSKIAHSVISRGDALTEELKALELLYTGVRPGFHPVLGVEGDEAVMPAQALLDLVLKRNPPMDPDHHFPSIFRPALPGETAFYFLGRPYFELGQGRGAPQGARKDHLLEEHSDHAWEANADALTRWVQDRSQQLQYEIKVADDGTQFMSPGVVGIDPPALKSVQKKTL